MSCTSSSTIASKSMSRLQEGGNSSYVQARASRASSVPSFLSNSSALCRKPRPLQKHSFDAWGSALQDQLVGIEDEMPGFWAGFGGSESKSETVGAGGALSRVAGLWVCSLPGCRWLAGRFRSPPQ